MKIKTLFTHDSSWLFVFDSDDVLHNLMSNEFTFSLQITHENIVNNNIIGGTAVSKAPKNPQK